MQVKEYEYLHVIKKLKQILEDWWDLKVLFFDEHHSCEVPHYDQKEKSSHSSFYGIFKSSEMVNSLSKIVKSCVEESKALDEKEGSYMFRKWDDLGSDVLIKPIFSYGEHMSSIVILFFFKEAKDLDKRLLELKGRLSVLGLSQDDVKEHVSKTKPINEGDRKHLIELVKVMGDEIITIYKELSNREKRILEINNAYSNKYSYHGMIGRSKSMRELYSLLDKIKSTNSTVIIQGENGSTDTKKVDVRILAATNKDLKKMVEAGTFREDLYYRLNVINVQVPPLRDRKEDISLLVDYFLSLSCKKKGVDLKTIDNSVIKRLYDYFWPGNVRELENEIERLVVLSADNQRISEEYLSEKIKENKRGDLSPVFSRGKLKEAIESVEKELIQEGLRRTGWNKSQLAKELGISRASLIMKVEKYALDKRKVSNR